MLEFFLTATNGQGKRETVCIQAATAKEAYSQVEADGYTDITLHTDDASAAATAPMPEADNIITPADMVELRSATDIKFFFFLLLTLYKQLRWIALSSVAFLVYIILSALAFTPQLSPTLVTLGIIAAAIPLGAPLAIALWSTLFSNTRKYQALVDAGGWGRWQEVIDIEPSLRGSVPDFELDVMLACAWVGQGKIDEGLALCQQHANDSEVPHWLYLGRLAEVYNLAHRHEEALDFHRQAYEEAPDNPTVVLDYALALLGNEVDLPRAQRLIAHAEAETLADMLQLMLPYIKGLAALNDKKNEDALTLFSEAEDGLKPLAPVHAVVRAAVDSMRAYRAITLAELGRTAEAQQLFGAVRPRFEALNSIVLIQRFERAIAK